MSTKEEQEVILSYLHPYLNFDKQYALLPALHEIELQARVMGITEEQLFSARVLIAERVRVAVNELSKDKEIMKLVADLPFEDGEKIVVIGDSNTADLGSWFYLLKHLVEEHRKDIKLTWVNHACSYHSSTDILRNASRTVLAEEGDWYICAVGLFDSARLDVSPDRSMIALAESWENLAAIEDVIDKVSERPIIWVTPHPVNESLQEQFEYFDLRIHNEDIQAFREVMSGRKGYLVETFNTLNEDEKGEWHYKPDGIHLSDSGQVVVLKELLKSIHLQKNG